MSASEHLRRATVQAHRELHGSDLARRFETGSIARHVYVDYLRATAVLVASLRTSLRRRGNEAFAGFLPTLDDWTDRLGADVRALAADDAVSNERAQDVVVRFMQEVYRHLRSETQWLYGVLYVLYGSHNGNRSIAAAISRGLELDDGSGTTYLRATEGEEDVLATFRTLVDAQLVSNEHRDLASEGAAATFACFRDVFRALEEDAHRGVKASAVNPEAGDHPVPRDRRLAELASEVGRASHVAFGYLSRRYGSRGESFARSDGVWMVTLTEMSATESQSRVDWLARMLSARGIPSICLEHHLERLHHALDREGESIESDPERLLSLSAHVGAARRSVVSDQDWVAITNTPVPSLDPLGAAVVASAMIDQRSGLADCADSMIRWVESTPALAESERAQLLAMLRPGAGG